MKTRLPNWFLAFLLAPFAGAVTAIVTDGFVTGARVLTTEAQRTQRRTEKAFRFKEISVKLWREGRTGRDATCSRWDDNVLPATEIVRFDENENAVGRSRNGDHRTETVKTLLGSLFALSLTWTASAATTRNDDSCDIAVLPAATLLLPYFERRRRWTGCTRGGRSWRRSFS